jgi:hypothetical protein
LIDDDKPIGVTLNRNLGSPRAPGEAVEADLTRLIESRSTREIDPDEREELWKASVRAYTARREEEMRAAWASYHAGQAERHRATLQALIQHHEERVAKLCEGEGGR